MKNGKKMHWIICMGDRFLLLTWKPEHMGWEDLRKAGVSGLVFAKTRAETDRSPLHCPSVWSPDWPGPWLASEISPPNCNNSFGISSFQSKCPPKREEAQSLAAWMGSKTWTSHLQSKILALATPLASRLESCHLAALNASRFPAFQGRFGRNCLCLILFQMP